MFDADGVCEDDCRWPESDHEDPPGPHPAVRETLLPVAGAARRARDVITETCIRWGLTDLIIPASVVVTELVANTIDHAGTLIDVYIVRQTQHLVIHVADGSTTVVTAPPPLAGAGPQALHERGRGLRLVDALAERWGCRIFPDGKVVWATLPVHAPR